MLEGFNDQWLEVDSRKRFATYTNLDPGDYTFRIWAADSDFCKDDTSDETCDVVTLNLKIVNENAQPNIAPFAAKDSYPKIKTLFKIYTSIYQSAQS